MVSIQFLVEESDPYVTASKLKKRKEMEGGSDDLTYLSNVRKSRRLDLELPPIIEEEESPVPIFIEKLQNNNSKQLPTMPEAEISLPHNEDRSLVLYQPNLNPIFHEVITLTLECNFLNKYKYAKRLLKDEPSPPASSANSCLTVVPYVASEAPNAMEEVEATNTSVGEEEEEEEEEAMDTEECDDDTSMDVEEEQQPMAEYTPMAMDTLGVLELEQYKQQFSNPVTSRSHVTWY